MSINLKNPETVMGKVDAATNYVAQIRIALMIGDAQRARRAVEQAERLLFSAMQQIEEAGTQEHLTAAKEMDWQQVVLNGGPPCFHLCEDGHFCGRAQRWAGHEDLHAFVSLADLLAAYIENHEPSKEGK